MNLVDRMSRACPLSLTICTVGIDDGQQIGNQSAKGVDIDAVDLVFAQFR